MLTVIEEAITKPPIPHEPYKHSLKNWAMYCLREQAVLEAVVGNLAQFHALDTGV